MQQSFFAFLELHLLFHFSLYLGRTYSPPASGRRYCLTAAVRSPRGTLQRAHVLLVAPKLGAVKGPASVLPASVLYGGQEGLKPLSFKMCAFQGEKPLTNRLLVGNGITFPIQGVVLAQAAVQSGDFSWLPVHLLLLSVQAAK